jgi:hypothetical protein
LAGHGRRCRSVALEATILYLFASSKANSQTGHGATKITVKMGVTEITPNLLVFSTANGNVVASVGPDGALLVGTPSTLSTAAISSVLNSRAKATFRYVVIMEKALGHSAGMADGDGWALLSRCRKRLCSESAETKGARRVLCRVGL